MVEIIITSASIIIMKNRKDLILETIMYETAKSTTSHIFEQS